MDEQSAEGVPPEGSDVGPTHRVTVVLVHGAWADGSSWSRVVPLLQARGINVVAAQNPGTSLAEDVTSTKRTLARVEGDIVLVAHSWGGSVITEAGNDPKVKALVYITAFAPDDGQATGDLVAAYPRPPALTTITDDGAGFLWQSEEGWIAHIAADLPAVEARVFAAVHPPLAAVSFSEKITSAAWKHKPTWFMASTQDRVIDTRLQQDAAARMNAKTTLVASNHLVIFSEPKAVAAVIQDAVNAIRQIR
jgi:pimeloyl-ACP methyl ester carboxylesterase